MTILIVDDQQNVIDGMLTGIRWKALGITEIYTANDARQARQVIDTHTVDILLCDIEMPGESGLALYRGLREEERPIECIFLTAHADFSYARDAIRLGGFDYILQPAKYEDVESAIQKAKQKIAYDRELRVYSHLYRHNYSRLIHGMLRDCLLNKDVVMQEVVRDLQAMQVEIGLTDSIHVMLVQRLAPYEEGDSLSGELYVFALRNILVECAEDIGCRALVVPMNTEELYVIIHHEASQPPQEKIIRQMLHAFFTTCVDGLKCPIACYCGGPVPVTALPDQARRLNRTKQDNVAMRSGIFPLETAGEPAGGALPTVDTRRWQHALTGGYAGRVQAEAFAYLDHAALDAMSLKQFYQDFMQVLAGACEDTGRTIYQLFDNKELFDRFLSAYSSVATMKEMVAYTARFFTESSAGSEDRYVDLITQYIHRNLERNIKRSDIAGEVNLNEDYLSRLFKQKMGVSLKEFIITEKMNSARSLIKNTTLPISAIASRVGFSNFSHFSQLYRKVIGVTPTEDRQEP